MQFEEGATAANQSCLSVSLNSPLAKGKTVDISKYTVHIDLLTPFPKQASQSDPQRVLLSANAYASSPYNISTQTTKVNWLRVFTAALSCLYSVCVQLLHGLLQHCCSMLVCHHVITA